MVEVRHSDIHRVEEKLCIATIISSYEKYRIEQIDVHVLDLMLPLVFNGGGYGSSKGCPLFTYLCQSHITYK